jgi:hypothetical protein
MATSSRVRFVEARDVVAAFPALKRLSPQPQAGVAALNFVGVLMASPRPVNAILYLAHILPRREAVWWARQTVRAIFGPECEADAAFRAADVWVRAPEEDRRRAALALGEAGDKRLATTWLALAVGWSGGSLAAEDQPPRAPRPSACAEAANAAIVLSVCHGPAPDIAKRIRASVDAGVRFAEGGDAQLLIDAAPDGGPRR